MKELIEDDQETEFILALFNGSEQYEFREQFKHLTVTHDDWFGMSEEQRKRKVATVYALSMEDLYETSDTQSQGRVYSVRCCNTKAIDPGTLNELSVPASALKDRLDIHIVQQIWHKAARILSQKDAIFPAPSRDPSIRAFSVLSDSIYTSNFVQMASSAKMTCTCKHYKLKKICLHVVTVAHNRIKDFVAQNRLKDFVSWYLKQKIPISPFLPVTCANTLRADTNISESAVQGVYITSSASSNPLLLPMTIPSSFSSPTVHVHSGVTQPSSVLIPTMESHHYLQPPPPQMSSINPHVAVPQGFPLPPKPPLPNSPNLYFLAKLKGNLARCNGCGTSFKKDALENNIDVAVIGRKERDWFPLVFADSSKCWWMGRSLTLTLTLKTTITTRRCLVSSPEIPTSKLQA